MAYNPSDKSVGEYKKRRRELAGELFDKVSDILFEYDPVGLNFETNVGEYEPETRTIIPLINEARDINHLSELVRGVFVQMFEGVDIDRKEGIYAKIAARIWEVRNLT